MAIGTPTSIGSASDAAAGTTLALTCSAAVAIGQKVIVLAACSNQGAPPGPSCTFTDSKGNIWRTDASAVATANCSIYIGSSDITVALTTSDTITATWGTSKNAHMIAAVQVSGLATGSASLDKTQVGTATSVNWDSGLTATTTQANELVIGGGTLNDSAGITSTPGGSNLELFDFINAINLTVVYQIVSATGTYKSNGTWSGGTTAYNAAVATYIAAAEEAGVSRNRPLMLALRKYQRAGGLFLPRPAPDPSPTFPLNGILDSGVGTDANPIAGNWAGPIENGTSQLKRLTNQLADANSPATYGESYWSATQFAADQEVYCTIPVQTVGVNTIAVWARVQNPGNASTATGYLAFWHPTDGKIRLQKLTAGHTYTNLAPGGGPPTNGWTSVFVAGDGLGLSAVGTQIIVWRRRGPVGNGWYIVGSVIDSSITGAGFIGLEIDDTTGRVTDFGGGTIPVVVVGGTTFPQAMTANTVLVTASMQRQTNKPVTATSVVVTATMLRQVNKLVTATAVVVTASMVRQVNKFLTATAVVVTATLATVKVKLLAMTATAVVVTASMVKQVNIFRSATAVVVTASMVRQVNKILTATAVVVTATLATIKVKLLAMTATAVVVTASMVRQVGKPLTATAVAVTASLVKQVGKRLTATTVVVTASLSTIKVKLVAMTATAVVVTASMVRSVGKPLSATVAVTGSIVKRVNKTMSATVSVLASLAAQASGALVGPFAAQVAIQDLVQQMVVAVDLPGAAVSTQDVAGTTVTATDVQGTTVTAQDSSGATVTVTDLQP